jgi:hypothetical protein
MTQRPAPDLQALVATHGTYADITPEAWAKFDAELEQWRTDLIKGRLFEHIPPPPKKLAAAIPSGSIIDGTPTDACWCGTRGQFGYLSNGTMLWYCKNHRRSEHWADARR